MSRVIVTVVTCHNVNKTGHLGLDLCAKVLACGVAPFGRTPVEVAFWRLKRHNVDRNGKS